MRRVLVVVSAGLLLAACSSSGGNPGGSPPAPVTGSTASGGSKASSPAAPPRNLKPQLLTVADLPSGWAVDNSSDSGGGTAPPCLRNVKAKLHTSDKAGADFVKGTDIPDFEEQLGYFGTSAALSGYTTITDILNRCKDFSFTTGGQKYTGSIGQLSFPKRGQHSTAWQIVLSVQGVSLGIDVLLVHKGSELALLLYGDLGTPDLSEFTSLVDKALAKVPAS